MFSAHLTVLRDLDLLALRNLGYVKMSLRDPQQKKTPGSIRRKPKLKEEAINLDSMQLNGFTVVDGSKILNEKH